MPQADWLDIVANRRCAQCGLSASTIDRDRLAGTFESTCDAWRELLTSASAAALRQRPNPDVWSAIEYAGHTRDVLQIFTDRIGRALVETDPAFGWWDHESSDLLLRYLDEEPGRVATEIDNATHGMVATLERIEGAAWDRSGVRRPGERFTVDGLVRFTLHESVHHLHDAAGSLSSATSSGQGSRPTRDG